MTEANGTTGGHLYEYSSEAQPEPTDTPISGNDGNEMNTQLLELQDAFVQALSASGALGKIRAQLRAAAVGLLRSDPDLRTATVGRTYPLPELPLVTQVSLLLVQDFLTQLELRETAGVFLAEAGTSFASEEAHAALADVTQHPHSDSEGLVGKGSELERLVQSALESSDEGVHPSACEHAVEAKHASGSNLATESEVPHDAEQDVLNQQPISQNPLPSEAAEKDDIESNVRVQQCSNRYEASLVFSDREGPISDEDAFEEIEVL